MRRSEEKSSLLSFRVRKPRTRRTRCGGAIEAVLTFVVARNPDPDSKLPYLIRLPLGADGLVLKARDVWPRTADVYCHRAERLAGRR